MVERRALIHALRVSEASDAFRSLFRAIEEQGERAGWLELDASSGADGGGDGGPWKSVVVEARRSVATKSRRGPAVLRDLLREHFRGCRLVLVRGDVELPELRRRSGDPDGWEIRAASGRVRQLTTAELVRALRAPRLGVE